MDKFKIEYAILDSNQWYDYCFEFKSLWAAVFKARAICEEHAANTRVINWRTGEVMVVFDINTRIGSHISEEMPDDIKKLALIPLN